MELLLVLTVQTGLVIILGSRLYALCCVLCTVPGLCIYHLNPKSMPRERVSAACKWGRVQVDKCGGAGGHKQVGQVDMSGCGGRWTQAGGARGHERVGACWKQGRGGLRA